jgi:hypothetical protein
MAGGIKRDPLVDDDTLGLPDHGALAEHAGIGELEGVGSADPEPARPGAPAYRAPAVGGPALVTGGALAAVPQGGEHHVVPGLDGGDRRPDLLHDPGPLVAQDDGRREGDGAVDDGDVAVAQARPHDAHLHLPVPRGADLDVVVDLELSRPDDSPHLYPLPPG